MRYSAILFDLDGTLIDSIGLYEEAMLHALRTIDLPVTSRDFYRWYTTSTHLPAILTEYGRTEHDVPTLRRTRDEYYENLLRTRAQWYEGAEDLLASLKGKIPVGMITGSWERYIDAIEQKIPLRKYFDATVTCDEMRDHMKPDPYGLLLAAKKLAVDPASCLYVGDQEFDVTASHRAGMECCIIERTYTPKDAGKDADYRLTSLREIPHVTGQATA